MKKITTALVLATSVIASASVFAEGTRISNSTIDTASRNYQSNNTVIDSSHSLASTGAINLQNSEIADSVIMNSSSNELTNNSVDNSSYSTAVTGSVTAY